MTRLEAYKVLFPEATIDRDGYPDMLPCEITPCEITQDKGTILRDCSEYDCEKKFWGKEVNFEIVEE